MRRKSNSLTNAIRNVIDNDDIESAQLPLIMGSARDRLKLEQVQIRQPTRVIPIKDQIVRIQQEADPVGFLIAAQNGELFEEIDVVPDPENPGQVLIAKHYTQATPKQRIEIARFLVNKIMPNLNVTKHIMDETNKDGNVDLKNPGKGGQSFDSLVREAARRVEDDVMRVLEDGRVEVTGVIPGTVGDDGREGDPFFEEPEIEDGC